MTPATATQNYLEMLWPELPAEQWLPIYTLPNKASHWAQSKERAAALVAEQSEVDVYLQIGLSNQNYGTHNRATRDNVSAIPGLWCDLDLRHGSRKKTALPTSVEELVRIIPTDAAPTMIVQSGGGLHAYWLFHEPLTFSTPAERDAAEQLLKDWQILLRRRAQAHGWTLDYTHDLPRILRVPGTLNLKDPDAPRAVTIASDNGPRYWPEQIREMLDDSEYSDRATGTVHSDRQDLGDGWKSLQLQIAPSASVDADLIEQLCQIDPKFRATWNHDRADIDGPEGAFSEYDLALANYGVRFSMTVQQIANMMIAFRRTHGGKEKMRPDYYRRTIWRAQHMREDDSVTLPPPVAQPAAPPVAGAPPIDLPAPAAAAAPPPPPAGDSDKVKLMERLSQWLGVTFLLITKLTGREPSYIIHTESCKIDIESVHKLIDQKYMRGRIAAMTGVLIERHDQTQWDRIVRVMLTAAIDCEVGEEMEIEGEAALMPMTYLSARPFASENSTDKEKSKFPTVCDGQITVSLADIKAWTTREYGPGERSNVKQLAALLASMGAKHVRWHKGNTDGHRWTLPTQWKPDRFIQVKERRAIA